MEESRVVFVEDCDGRGEGIESFEISVKDKDSLLVRAEEKGLLKDGEVYIGGVKFLLN